MFIGTMLLLLLARGLTAGRNRVGEMAGELSSLRLLTASGSAVLRDAMRAGMESLSAPVDASEAGDAAAASRILAQGIDIAFVDSALGPEQCAAIARAGRTASKTPFLIVLADARAERVSDGDGVSVRPVTGEEARRLVERAIRLRLPSRVLIVDDSRTMRGIVRKILEATRFPLDVSEAGEGLAALKLVRDGGFDIIFLDYNMPEFNGIETLAEIKREKRPVSVVMMSTSHDEALAEKARAHGAAAFLKKPFFPADIDTVLCRYYGLRALNPHRA
jgi:CheY-like chemotaxis protein